MVSLPDLMLLNNLEKLELCSSPLTCLSTSGNGLPPALKQLKVRNCDKLKSLIAEEGIKINGPSLQSISISCCMRLKTLPDLTLLNNLEKLYLYSCPLTCLSSGSGLPPALKELTVTECAELKSLIAEEGIKIYCPSLESVEISDCVRLKTLPVVMQNNNGLKNLSRLKINGCHNLESLPEGWFPTTDLHIVRCEKLEPLPNHAYSNNNLASLEKLRLIKSPQLLSHIPDEGSSSCFTNLTSLFISDVDIGKLCGLHRLYSLRVLSLFYNDWVSFREDWMLSFPSSLVVLQICYFPNLEKLSFKDFENLVSLEQLEINNCPKLTAISELEHLPSLLNLEISECTNLASFPEQPLPPSLLSLHIKHCPMLWQLFKKGKGQYWGFIAHIPQVMINHLFVFDPRW
ncbi:hypothetical protein RHMOL_Rhmol01G0049900 [Rhododendron molle]|uniref:Uncharacterized protein n=1 Tax=Rhododendron molle TaxID=49168 RepID=A0ACC0PZN2_RHOML|nr:hypothetical protein RHMOL_Rhmol01G0049900 [Rhododendron molle]